jgi:hypothetical protein
MKYFIIIFLPLCLTWIRGNSQSAYSTIINNFGIKSCKIIYKFTNGPQSGIKTVIFDDWGATLKEVVTTVNDTSMMKKALTSINDSLGKTQIPGIERNLLLKASDQSYSIDLDRHVGNKISSVSVQFRPDPYKNQEVIVGTDTILGKPCQIAEIHDAFRFWIWKKIILRKQIIQSFNGIRVEEYATEIDDGYIIKPDEFKIPDNIQILEHQ